MNIFISKNIYVSRKMQLHARRWAIQIQINSHTLVSKVGIDINTALRILHREYNYTILRMLALGAFLK